MSEDLLFLKLKYTPQNFFDDRVDIQKDVLYFRVHEGRKPVYKFIMCDIGEQAGVSFLNENSVWEFCYIFPHKLHEFEKQRIAKDFLEILK
jgi:hypothetical protein